MAQHPHILEDDAAIRRLIAQVHRIAVLGIKVEAQAHQPAFYVPEYLVAAGFDVVPVPVYFPEVTQILGRRVYRRLAEVPPPLDLVLVFRRSEQVAQHEADILAARPGAVWLQLGIQDDALALRLAHAGIRVVQNRCLMVEHRRAGVAEALS